MNETAQRERICATAKSLFDRGLTHGSTGNVSARCDDGWLLTPTGSNLGSLDPARLSKLDWTGKLIGGDPPSKENFLHLAMYQERANAGAVVHLHSTYSVAVSVLEDVSPEDVLPPITAYYVMRIGRLPLIPYFAPGDMKLRKRFVRKHAVTMLFSSPIMVRLWLQATWGRRVMLSRSSKRPRGFICCCMDTRHVR